MEIKEDIDNGCCEVCNTDDDRNNGYFVPEQGRDVWLCPYCAKLYEDEIDE